VLLRILSTWDFEPLPAVGILVALGLYLWGVMLVGVKPPGRRWPVGRTVSFLSALALLWIAVMGPIGAYDDTFFWAHMTQHLMMMMVVAPLLVIGAPVLLLLQASSRATRKRWIVPVLRSRAMWIITNPVLTWLLFAGVLLGTHFSPLYNYATVHPMVHQFVEHPLYLGVALLYYYPLVGANPNPHGLPSLGKAVSLLLQMVPETMTGFFIFSAGYVLYPAYATVYRPFGPAPLPDQQLGGALMWGVGMVIDAVWIAIAVRGWLREEERKARRIDQEIARSAGQADGRLPA